VGLGNRRDCCSYIEWSRSAATDAFRMRQIIIIRIKYIYDLYLYIGEEKGLRARLSTLLYHVYILYGTRCGVVCVIQSATESRSDILFYFMYYFAPPPPQHADRRRYYILYKSVCVYIVAQHR